MIAEQPKEMNDRRLGLAVRAAIRECRKEPTVENIRWFQQLNDEATERLVAHARMLGYRIEEMSNLKPGD